jgi:predicted O-methyltransferase YrrM
MDTETPIPAARRVRCDLQAASEISMMWIEDLRILNRLAAEAAGPVIEIGPYVGGSTAFIADALGADRHLITIEQGGSYPDHPKIPSDDIIRDLTANLQKLGITDRVSVVEGLSHSPLIKSQVAAMLGGRAARMLFIDADCGLARALYHYAPFLSDDCILAFDDYNADESKSEFIRLTIDRMVSDGAVVGLSADFQVWFGRVNGQRGLSMLQNYNNLFLRENGHCFFHTIVAPWKPDGISDPKASAIELLEDGRPLLPHASHDEIRAIGRGTFSHWQSPFGIDAAGNYVSNLYFSTSDNTDPSSNGRLYQIRADGETIDIRRL